MQLRWSEEAADDLERITNYLFEETPQNALVLVRALYNAPAALLQFPHRGRLGRRRERGNWCLRSCPTSWFIESQLMPSTSFAFCTARRNGLSAVYSANSVTPNSEFRAWRSNSSTSARYQSISPGCTPSKPGAFQSRNF